jgi:hypothetical protein
MNSRTSNNIHFSFNGKRPLKKVHRIAGRTFIVIDEALVRLLSINENTTWLEQQAIENGILMKIHYFTDDINETQNPKRKEDVQYGTVKGDVMESARAEDYGSNEGI